MEKEVAILMADLAGYTALTEAHGASSAADLIDKYLEIVKNCLVDDCELQERTGDEVMIISSSPDQLLSTALMLIQTTHMEHNFLQLHGGLHYGKLLERNNSYFGTSLNLTSRIASIANPGTFWCSDQFINALSKKDLFNIQPKGKHSFKNLSEENELYELVPETEKILHIDPVCRMLIVNYEKAISHPIISDLYFCSKECFEKYSRIEILNSL
jgi:adenylate cyclase